MFEVLGNEFRCEMDFTTSMISGKWKIDIIYYLYESKVLRFGEMKNLINNITHKILAQQLDELEFYKIISRKVYPVVPPKVEYKLTESGEELAILFFPMIEWAKNHKMITDK